jgi:hypothetical protein
VLNRGYQASIEYAMQCMSMRSATLVIRHECASAIGAQRPIGQFCAYQGWLHRSPVATHIGGSARVLIQAFRH